MTVSSADTGAIRVGNGVTTVFSFTFETALAAEIKVSNIIAQALVPVLSGFVVALDPSGNGGTVTFTVPPVNGLTFYIYRDTALSQLTSVSGQQKYDPSVAERVWDKLTFISQELAANVALSLKVAPGGNSATLLASIFAAQAATAADVIAADADAVSAAASAVAAASSAPLPSTTGHGGKPLRANANGVGVEFGGIFATTATAAGTTTLVNGSADNQHFTGVLAQTLVLPVVSTLAQGREFLVINDSTGAIAIQSSGLNAVASVPAKTVMRLACQLITGTDALSWNAKWSGFDITPALIRAQLGLVIGVNVEAFGGGAPLSRVSPLIWKAVPANNNGTLVGFKTINFVGAGATSTLVAVTNRFTYMARYEALVTVAAITAVAGFTMGELFVTVGGPAGLGGFRFIGRWGPATGVATTTNRAFFGLSNTTANPTDVQPSSLLNAVFMGWDAADANIQIMHNDGAGTCTKIDLGASFPVPLVDRTSVYELELTSPAGVTQSVTYLVTDLISGATATGTVTTNLPAVATLLTPHGYMSVGGTSSVIGMALYSLYLDPLV